MTLVGAADVNHSTTQEALPPFSLTPTGTPPRRYRAQFAPAVDKSAGIVRLSPWTGETFIGTEGSDGRQALTGRQKGDLLRT